MCSRRPIAQRIYGLLLSIAVSGLDVRGCRDSQAWELKKAASFYHSHISDKYKDFKRVNGGTHCPTNAFEGCQCDVLVD